MSLVHPQPTIALRLHKNLTRVIKRGQVWLFSDALESRAAPGGSPAILNDRSGKAIASGIYDPEHTIPLRICRTAPPWTLDDKWLTGQLERASALRRQAIDPELTTGYRLLAGEGDGLPGLIVDVYDRTAVVKLDGGAPESFYRVEGIADWLMEHHRLQRVVQRFRGKGQPGKVVCGEPIAGPVRFSENGLLFTADVIHGQKTGFFLDQRDNRAVIKSLSRGCSVLNLFSFNGGFSVAAGRGGARHVTSVDIAAPAIEAAELHWGLNDLPSGAHSGVAQDCFGYLEEVARSGEHWDIVICDPPSFAPSEKTRENALSAYTKLAQSAARVTRPGGLLALASCSSHITRSDFAQVNLEGIGRARRVARLVSERGLPIDHPTPFAMPELRYLKFMLFQLD